MNCLVAPDDTVAVAGMMLTVTVAALTVSVKDLLAVCRGDEESATWTVKLNCPARLVVPEIDPDDCNAIPEGRVPEVNVQL